MSMRIFFTSDVMCRLFRSGLFYTVDDDVDVIDMDYPEQRVNRASGGDLEAVSPRSSKRPPQIDFGV